MRSKLWRLLELLEKPLIWGGVIVVIGFLLSAILNTEPKMREWDQFWFNVVLLIFTGAALDLAIPHRATIRIAPQEELGFADLVFFDQGERPPHDYLIQTHIVVTNVGGRQAVLSSVVLDDFLDRHGRPVRPSLNPIRVAGKRYTTLLRYTEGYPIVGERNPSMNRENVREEIAPPFTLGPDDVIALRIRGREGIDWSDRWNMPQLDAVARQLERPIVRARVVAAFRRGGELVHQKFTFPISVAGQEAYLNGLQRILATPALRDQINHTPIVDW